MDKQQKMKRFMAELGQSSCFDEEKALQLLAEEIRLGLKGRGPLPLYPAYIPAHSGRQQHPDCISIDIGGSTLRTARVHFQEDGRPLLTDVKLAPLPGLHEELSEPEFYRQIAAFSAIHDNRLPVAVSYSYTMESLPGPDGLPKGWSKEVCITSQSGRSVATLLREACGVPDLTVAVVNDAVASALAACYALTTDQSLLGIIVGTGFNICAVMPRDLLSAEKFQTNHYLFSEMIINTEAGESHAFSLGLIDKQVIEASSDPYLAQAEKQCSGKYLEKIIHGCLREAAARDLIESDTPFLSMNLPALSALLMAEEEVILQDEGLLIIRECFTRSAVIAAVTSAAFVIAAGIPQSLLLSVEGSIIKKVPGYLEVYTRKLETLLKGTSITFVTPELPCLTGAALAL